MPYGVAYDDDDKSCCPSLPGSRKRCPLVADEASQFSGKDDGGEFLTLLSGRDCLRAEEGGGENRLDADRFVVEVPVDPGGSLGVSSLLTGAGVEAIPEEGG
jgi:hypothetical protein